MIKRFAFALAVLIGFVSCAPAPLGSVTNPVTLESGSAQLRAGETVYIKVAGPVTLITRERREQDLGKFINVTSRNFTIGAQISVLVNWVRLSDARVPDGWKLELNTQFGVRQVTNVDSQYIYFSDRLELVFAVTAPGNVQPGNVITLEATVASQSSFTTTSTVRIPVQIVN